MCGFAGFVEARGPDEAEGLRRLRSMVAPIAHRGPDDEGVWVDAEAGAGLGFRRLAILDLSAAGHQPMTSASGRYVIVFNGEIYNFADLRDELGGEGAGFRGHSDTEVVLAAFDRWGIVAALPRLWGMFAMAVWDRQQRTLTLARDRLGKKPLYYGRCGGAWLFGSELKALRSHPAFDGRIDRRALSSYTRFGYVPAPWSIYEGIAKLPPGCWVEIGHEGAGPARRYWDARAIAREGTSEGALRLPDDEAIEALDRLLRDAVRRRMVADVPLGAFLSGGIDSSTVVALMQQQSSRPVRTFSIGFHIAGYDEAKAAADVAAHLRTDHTELYVTPQEAQDVIPRLPSIYDEPFADSSQVPTFLVSQLARRHVTVALSGDGGDELFAGYTRYVWAESIWRAVAPFPRAVRAASARVLGGVGPGGWDAVLGPLQGLVPAHWRVSHPGDKVHKVAGVLSSSTQTDLYRRLVSLWKEPVALVEGGDEYATVLSDAGLERELPGFTERMMLLDLVSYLPDDILVKVDRASMAVSLEVRGPLLDHRVAEFAWRLPLHQKRRDGVSKWILRQVLERYVPPALVERPKMGFGIPIHEWLRGPLREWAESLLDERRLREDGFFAVRPVRDAWREHLSGRRNDQYRIWAVLMFQAWLDHVSSGRGAGRAAA